MDEEEDDEVPDLVENFDEVFNQIRDFIIFLFIHSSTSTFHSTHTLSSRYITCQPLQVSKTLGSKLVEDARQHFSNLFILGVSSNSKSISSKTCLNLRVIEVDDGSIVLYHVDFLDARNIID